MSFKFYVYYDSEGNITAVSNEKRSSGDFIEAEESEVKDFLTGIKDFTKFKITNLSSGTKTIKLNSDSSTLVYKDFYIISKSKNDEQVIITHDSNNKCWIVKVDSNEFLEFSIFISQKNNLNFLIREIKVPAKKFVSIPFESYFENDIKNIIVIAKKTYKSFGLNYA